MANAFVRVVESSQILVTWQSDAGEGGTPAKLARVAASLGISSRTARRALLTAGVLSPRAQSPSSRRAAVQAVRTKPIISATARTVLAAAGHAGVSIRETAAGIMLADVLLSQRADITRLATINQQLTAQLCSFVEPQADLVTGEALPIHEDTMAKAISLADKVSQTTERLHQMQRDAWGITKEAMQPTHGDVLDQLREAMKHRR